MRKIALIIFSALPLFAGFFPATTHTSITKSSGEKLILSTPLFANGMSGVVVHDYGNNLKAITGRFVQTSKDGQAKIVTTDIIHHDKLPTIKTPIKAGDSAIGGYLYNNVLLLAPDADTYARITSQDNKKWIHPDLFALFLSQEGEARPTRANLSLFAKRYQVGLIYIVRKNSAILLDPFSGSIINQKSMDNLPSKAQYPFYMRFDKIDSGWFSSNTTGNYYNTMETL